MCSGSQAGSYLRLIDLVSLHSRLESNKEEEEKNPTLTPRTCGETVSPPNQAGKHDSLRAELALRCDALQAQVFFSSSFLLSSLELSDRQVYEP